MRLSRPHFRDPRPDHAAATDERHLLEAARRGDAKARERLVRDHLRLVSSIARGHARPGIELEDLVSEGVCGLLEAIDRFDLERDNRFSTYATYWVRERVGAYARRMRGLVAAPETRLARRVLRARARVQHRLTVELKRAPSRAELAAALDVPEDELAALEPIVRGMDVHVDAFEADDPRGQIATNGDSPEEAYATRQAAAHRKVEVGAALARLGARERVILERRFMGEDDVSLTELGAELGVSRERVRQLQEAARGKIARALAA